MSVPGDCDNNYCFDDNDGYDDGDNDDVVLWVYDMNHVYESFDDGVISSYQIILLLAENQISNNIVIMMVLVMVMVMVMVMADGDGNGDD